MSDLIHLVIPGAPQGKGRARSFVHRRGGMAGRIGHYTPEKTRTYEGIVKSLALDAMSGRKPFACPVTLNIAAVMPVPASWPAWKRTRAIAGAVAPTGKPDIDNITKAVLDGCNGVFWIDDAQVVGALVSKSYGAHPRVEIHLHALTDKATAQGATKPLQEAA